MSGLEFSSFVFLNKSNKVVYAGKTDDGSVLNVVDLRGKFTNDSDAIEKINNGKKFDLTFVLDRPVFSNDKSYVIPSYNNETLYFVMLDNNTNYLAGIMTDNRLYISGDITKDTKNKSKKIHNKEFLKYYYIKSQIADATDDDTDDDVDDREKRDILIQLIQEKNINSTAELISVLKNNTNENFSKEEISKIIEEYDKLISKNKRTDDELSIVSNKYPTKSVKTIKGIANLGVSCYINATTQLFLHMPEIDENKFKIKNIEDFINKNKYKYDKKTTTEHIIQEYEEAVSKIENIKEFFNQYKEDKITELMIRKYTEALGYNGNQDDADIPLNILLENYSDKALFTNIFQTQVKCQGQNSFGILNNREEPQFVFMVNENEKYDIQQMYDNQNNTEEVLSNANRKSDFCEGEADSMKSRMICTAKYVFIRLKIFTQSIETRTEKKIQQSIQLNSKLKVYTDIKDDSVTKDYNIHGVIYHIGESINSGHYTSCVVIDDKLYHFDDDKKVKVVHSYKKELEFLPRIYNYYNGMPYILVYKRPDL